MYTKQFSSENLARTKRREQEEYDKLLKQLADPALKPERRELLRTALIKSGNRLQKLESEEIRRGGF